jgi:hypothetical protein
MKHSDMSRRDRQYFAQRKRQARAHERLLGGAAAMDLAFLNRARKFMERRGLYSNPKARAALAELEFETADLIKKQS